MNLLGLLALAVVTSNTPRERLAAADRWAYQLQGAQLDELLGHGAHDRLVFERARTGENKEALRIEKWHGGSGSSE